MAKKNTIYFTKEEFKKYYLDENHSLVECKEYFNLGQGVINRYIRENNLKKYDTPQGRKDAQKHNRETCIKKYGHINPHFKGSKSYNKRIETTRERYGVDHISQLDVMQKKAKEGYKKSTKVFRYTENNINLACESTFNRYTRENNLYHLRNPKLSYLEKEVMNFLEELGVNYYKQVRIKNVGIDFYLPDFKVAIECNGNFWHSLNDMTNRDSKYHLNKSKKLEELGIRTIHIWEYEWNNKRQRPILKNIIEGSCNLNKTIYARNTLVEVVKPIELKEFFNLNNIQGYRGGTLAYVLKSKSTGEVLMAYIVGSCFFGKGKYQYEIIRGATKLGFNIVGGASKLWKYIIDKLNPDNIVYYIDYNYFNGNSLEHLNYKGSMNYIKTTISFKNYFKKTNQVKNRQPTKHKEIKELYEKGEVLKIYNAGVKSYVWTKETNDE